MLDRSTNQKLLAVVDIEDDDLNKTFFYQYKDGQLISLGNMLGTVLQLPAKEAQAPFNSTIETDGRGHLVPAFGVLQYLTPNLLLRVYTIKDSALQDTAMDLTSELDRQYKVSNDIQPFFEKGSYAADQSIRCNSDNIITLQKDSEVTLLDASNSYTQMEYVTVRLTNGLQGILYFFLHP